MATIQIPSPCRHLTEEHKDPFYFGDLASVDVILNHRLARSTPDHILPTPSTPTTSTAPSSPLDGSDQVAQQSSASESSECATQACPSCCSSPHGDAQSPASTATATASVDWNPQQSTGLTAAQRKAPTTTAADPAASITASCTRPTLAFFPPTSPFGTGLTRAAPAFSPVRADAACFFPSATPTAAIPSPRHAHRAAEPPLSTAFRTGDWMCAGSNCHFHNYSRNAFCGSCGAMKPSEISNRLGFGASRAKKGGSVTKCDPTPVRVMPHSWQTPTLGPLRASFQSHWSPPTPSPPDPAPSLNSAFAYAGMAPAGLLSHQNSSTLFANDGQIGRTDAFSAYPVAPRQGTCVVGSQAHLSTGMAPLEGSYYHNCCEEAQMYPNVGPHQAHIRLVQHSEHQGVPTVSLSPFTVQQLSPHMPFEGHSLPGNASQTLLPHLNRQQLMQVKANAPPSRLDLQSVKSPNGAKPLFGNRSSSGGGNDDKRGSASANEMTRHLAMMGVGVGPGVNPNMECAVSPPLTSSDLRSPTIREGPPPPPPIINSGSVGPMLVQAGDWICSHCSFVNWRRRRVCMRCYPFAEGNEIALSLSNGALLAARVAAGVEIPESDLASLTKSRSANHAGSARGQHSLKREAAHFTVPAQTACENHGSPQSQTFAPTPTRFEIASDSHSQHLPYLARTYDGGVSAQSLQTDGRDDSLMLDQRNRESKVSTVAAGVEQSRLEHLKTSPSSGAIFGSFEQQRGQLQQISFGGVDSYAHDWTASPEQLASASLPDRSYPLHRGDGGNLNQKPQRLAPIAATFATRGHEQHWLANTLPSQSESRHSPPGSAVAAKFAINIPPALGSPSFASPSKSGDSHLGDLPTPSGRSIKEIWQAEDSLLQKTTGDSHLTFASGGPDGLRLHFGTSPVQEKQRTGPLDTFEVQKKGNGLVNVPTICTTSGSESVYDSGLNGQDAPKVHVDHARKFEGRPAPIGTRPTSSSRSTTVSP